jgi:hypothetical protein
VFNAGVSGVWASALDVHPDGVAAAGRDLVELEVHVPWFQGGNRRLKSLTDDILSVFER